MITKARLTWGALLLLTALSGPGCNNTTTAADAAAALSAAGITLSKDPLMFTDVTSTSLTVNWAAGKSSTVAASKLLYQVFYTEVDPGLTKPTVASIKASGWTLAGPAVANITSMSIIDLSPSTTYYFTVISSDGGINTAVYPVTAQTTGFTLADATLTASAITGTGLTLNWSAAVDDATLAAKISYNVYYSTLATLTTGADWRNAAKATAVGNAATAITTKDITGLSVNTTYYFMVIASDPTGNSTLYDSLTETTAVVVVDTTAPTVVVDTTPPTVSSGTITASSITSTSITLSWDAATDNISAPSALQYRVYYTTGSANTFDTISDIQANGTTAVGTFIPNLGTETINNLTPGATYQFQVLVQDEAGNLSKYTTKQQTTDSTYIYMYNYGIPSNGNLGGRSGADAMCWGSGAKPSACSTQANTHAFLTVSSSDYLSTDHFATTSSTQPPSTSTIVNNINSYQIAPNWNSLLTAGPCQSGSSNSTCSFTSLSDVLGSSRYPWIGTSDNNCNGWTSALSLNYGTIGFFNNNSSMPIFLSHSQQTCDTSSHFGLVQSLICVCW